MRRKIIVDLDGTIIDARQRLYQLFRFLVPESQLSLDDYWELKRNKIDHTTILEKEYHKDGFSIAKFQQEWLKLIELPEWLALDTLIDGAFDTIDKLSKRCDLYLLTSRQSIEFTMWQLESLSVLPFFKKILITQHKVEKEVLLIESNIKIQSTDIVIGDTGIDIELAKTIGCIGIGVTSGFRNRSILEKYEPNYLLNSIADPQFMKICLQ